MINPIKMGSGAGFMILGLYLINLNTSSLFYVIPGIILISVGIGIITSQ